MSYRWSCDCACLEPLSHCGVAHAYGWCNSYGAGDCPSTIVANITVPALPLKWKCCDWIRRDPPFTGPWYCDYEIIDAAQYPADTLDITLTNGGSACTYFGYADIDYVTSFDCVCDECPRGFNCTNYSYASVKRRITVSIQCCSVYFLWYTPCSRPELEVCQDTEGGATYFPCCGVAGAISYQLSENGVDFYGPSWSFTWKASDNPSISECTDKCPCLSQFGTPIEHSVGAVPEYQGWKTTPNQYGYFGQAIGTGDLHINHCGDESVGGTWFLGSEYPVASLNSLS